MVAKNKKGGLSTKEIRNAKAFHKYDVGEKFEAGISLLGTEVKSIRQGKAQISEAFVRIEKGNAILYHAHIQEYDFGNLNNHNPLRPRQLLLHRRELNKLKVAIENEGKTIVPLRIFFRNGLIKIELAICKGKKLYDKREDLKKRTAQMEAQRALKNKNINP